MRGGKPVVTHGAQLFCSELAAKELPDSGQEKRNSLTLLPGAHKDRCISNSVRGQAGSERFLPQWSRTRVKTCVYREVAGLGAILKSHPELANHKTNPAQIAMVFDYERYWHSCSEEFANR